MEITEKLINFLKENGIQKNEMSNLLLRVSKEIESSLWENLRVNSLMFYNLKDMIWYNLEHLPNSGEEKGLSDLRYLGTKFPRAIYCANESNIISLEEIPDLYQELETIISLWNKEWKFVNLYTNSQDGWQGGSDNPSRVIIYNIRTESPSKYGYNQHYGSIVGVTGKPIKKLDENIVLCSVDGEIGEYSKGAILYSLLIKLKETCKRALQNEKDIRLEFEFENAF